MGTYPLLPHALGPRGSLSSVATAVPPVGAWHSACSSSASESELLQSGGGDSGAAVISVAAAVGVAGVACAGVASVAAGVDTGASGVDDDFGGVAVVASGSGHPAVGGAEGRCVASGGGVGGGVAAVRDWPVDLLRGGGSGGGVKLAPR